jgi:hypothetical protein
MFVENRSENESENGAGTENGIGTESENGTGT